jgi:hypothetical protein
MIRTLLATLLATASIHHASCQVPSATDQIATDLIAQFDRLPVVVESVKDKATAEKAVADLEQIGEEIKKIGERAKGLKISAAGQKELEAKLGTKVVELKSKLAAAMQKAQAAGPEALETLKTGMIKWGEAMKKFGNDLQQAGQ